VEKLCKRPGWVHAKSRNSNSIYLKGILTQGLDELGARETTGEQGMRVSLVSPKWNRMVNSYPPLGLAYLAAVLERAGHEVRVHDFGLHPDVSLSEHTAEVAGFDPALVGITAMTNTYHSAAEAARLLKEEVGCPIVLGGPHPTVFPERVAAEPFVDYVVYGEGEETLAELVRAIDAEGSYPRTGTLAAIDGLCYTDDDGVRRNPERALIRDLDALPYPARHLFDVLAYPLYAPNGDRMITVLSSRGCPYNCSYCFKGIVGRTYRQRSPDSLMTELHQVVSQYGITNIYFIDDLFTMDLPRLKAVTQRIIEEDLDIRWQCLARVDRVNPEVLGLMHRSGCRGIHYGIESGNDEILEAIGKHITKEQVRKAVEWTAQAGIRSKGYFMLGLPGDTEETMRQTIEFAAELDLDDAMFSLTTPFPGTRLWAELVAKRPEVEFNQDFSRAFYYNNYSEEIEPFLNVSEVSDQVLSRMAAKAKRSFAEGKRKRKYTRAFGQRLGSALWGVSRLPLVRDAGRALLNCGVLGDLGNFREERTREWT